MNNSKQAHEGTEVLNVKDEGVKVKEAKKRKGRRLQGFMAVQALVSEYWDFDKWGFIPESLEREDMNDLAKKVEDLLFEAMGEYPYYTFCIIHDRDVHVNEAGVIEAKTRHVHILVKFQKGSKGMHVDEIAEALGFGEQYVEKPNKGRYAFDNMLAYMVHAKSPEKHAYSPEDVGGCLRSEKGGNLSSYLDVYEANKEKWEQGRSVKSAQVKRETDKDVLALVEERVRNGQYRNLNDFLEQANLSNELMSCYMSNKRKIQDWFDAYQDLRIANMTTRLGRGDFDIKVLYVTGKAGSGKSRFANALIKKLLEKHPTWSCFSGGSTNPVDGYAGEEVVFFDDLRGNAMSASDWLKLLDPYNASPTSARYQNKTIVSQFIIITSVQNVYDFFYYIRGMGSDREEPMGQFIRRLLGVVEVFETEDGARISFSLTDKGSHTHEIRGVDQYNREYRRDVKMDYRVDDDRPLYLDYDKAAEMLGDLFDADKIAEVRGNVARYTKRSLAKELGFKVSE